MFRSYAAVASLALGLGLALSSVPAMAQPGDHGAKVGHREEQKFPMPAADFKAHVARRQEKARAKLEEHIANKKVADDKAKELRARFEAGVARVNAEVEKACADGTVTKEEADAVRAVAKAAHGGHHHKKDKQG